MGRQAQSVIGLNSVPVTLQEFDVVVARSIAEHPAYERIARRKELACIVDVKRLA
jgi:hypothetical protein